MSNCQCICGSKTFLSARKVLIDICEPWFKVVEKEVLNCQVAVCGMMIGG